MESSLSSPSLQLHLLFSLVAPMGETVETADKAMKVFARDNSTLCECRPLRIPRSFKRFFHCGSKVLGVVQSTKCFVSKWGIPCRFSTCVFRNFLYLDTDFVDILFRVPQCYLYKHCFSTYKFHLLKKKTADFFEPSELLFGQIQCRLRVTAFFFG